MVLSRIQLKARIVRSLRSQGFSVRRGRLVAFDSVDKDEIRSLHAVAVRHRIDEAKPRLVRHESELLRWIANGSELVPANISPRLILVQRGSIEELVFRYARLHWSVPVSAGYGRRLRYLVVDDSNKKLIGVIGLCDPVMNLGARDSHIGWSSAAKASRLRYVLDAFVLGAVPPYSYLLCGKLMAMLATSWELREDFAAKYASVAGRISGAAGDGRLALVTTTSALGRSSLYNRLVYNGAPLFSRVGLTAGSGEFHFANGLYSSMSAYAELHCAPTGKHASWGAGFRNRREVVKKCLQSVGLSSEWVYHGVRREVYVAPLAKNALAFLRGEHSRLQHTRVHAADLISHFRQRWLLPRSLSDLRYVDWRNDAWRLW